MTVCGNVKRTRAGRAISACGNQAGEGSMFCDQCKAAALERVRSMPQPPETHGLRWPTKGRA